MIRKNARKLIEGLPGGVEIVAAAKGRTPEEIMEAVRAGIGVIGENYVQEAEKAFEIIGGGVKWHFIGHLQKNKVKKTIKIFDMIETVDSLEIAKEIDKRCAAENKIMDVLIEINIGREERKFGAMPEDIEGLLKKLSELNNIKVKGLMTMGPLSGDPESARPYFFETKKIFEKVKETAIPRIEMKYLSMGMSDSYKTAVEEGANMVRIGTGIFGERKG
jgi:PLP dependent protein